MKRKVVPLSALVCKDSSAHDHCDQHVDRVCVQDGCVVKGYKGKSVIDLRLERFKFCRRILYIFHTVTVGFNFRLVSDSKLAVELLKGGIEPLVGIRS